MKERGIPVQAPNEDKGPAHAVVIHTDSGGYPSVVKVERRRRRGNGGRINRVEVYYFDHCRQDDNVYWHETGSEAGPVTEEVVGPLTDPTPPKCGLWIAEGIRVVRKGGAEVRDSELLAMGTVRLHFPPRWRRGWDAALLHDPFQVFWTESRTVWCRECRDSHPIDDDYSELDPCEHIEWDAESMDYIYIGTEEVA